ncbi:hypothetical protein J8J04_02830 ['Fragaria x ananassa' phyllody phytoplasma]|uniref:Uncharacterized protein n=1 Tax='Fragaria x ananassa' phyllody phytoplasma TaxID=2358428 RepID=A0ABS5K3V4_9MOLU|nr:hypothetical protein ['Fragaria x ananassa' phyllody phytoplasma]MBS2126604.1 hypothetical protein ['Fragaria x ananassa' phyllody phytoplasma]
MVNKKMPKRNNQNCYVRKDRIFCRNFYNYDNLEKYEKQIIKNINLEWRKLRGWRD